MSSLSTDIILSKDWF